ncbi:MAG: hypothetical protein ABIQ88_12760 [Chitinophagaceae bacterium]
MKKMKWAHLALAASILVNLANAQQIAPLEIMADAVEVNQPNSDLLQYGLHKQLPPGYEKETLQALSHFPELKSISIKFRVKKSFATLKTRPTFLSMFMPKGKRSYIITISNKTAAKLMPLMFANLSTEARVGIIGHELSHVVDFSTRNNWQCIKMAAGHLSPGYLDRFEYHTDMICIQHGLGTDLEAWSSYIRNTMHTVFWRGAGYVYKGDIKYERYMNPSTIEKNMPLNGNTTTGAGAQAK